MNWRSTLSSIIGLGFVPLLCFKIVELTVPIKKDSFEDILCVPQYYRVKNLKRKCITFHLQLEGNSG